MIEQEIKLTATTPATLTKVLQSALVKNLDTNINNQDAARYTSAYYDTAERALAAKRYSLRARRQGKRWRAALKFNGSITNGFSQRREMEVDIGGWLANAGALPEGELKDKVLQVIPADAPLMTRVRVEMFRSIRNLNLDGTDIELCADNATIFGKTQHTVLYEVELELKRGDVAKIIELGEMLKQQFALTPSTMTKHRIGLQLE